MKSDRIDFLKFWTILLKKSIKILIAGLRIFYSIKKTSSFSFYTHSHFTGLQSRSFARLRRFSGWKKQSRVQKSSLSSENLIFQKRSLSGHGGFHVTTFLRLLSYLLIKVGNKSRIILENHFENFKQYKSSQKSYEKNYAKRNVRVRQCWIISIIFKHKKTKEFSEIIQHWRILRNVDWDRDNNFEILEHKNILRQYFHFKPILLLGLIVLGE